MSNDEGFVRPLPQSVFTRLGAAARFVISGIAPDSWFGPQQPLPPQAPADVKGRQFDYPFGANLNYTPRSSAAIGFGELRALADALPLLRTVIETRKDQVFALGWTVRPRALHQSSAADSRISQILAFLARPDRRHSFADWLRMILEDLLVIDAATIYPRFNRAGALHSLDIVDGATIFPLIGEDGRAPDAPDPAWQQVLHGIPAADFTCDELLYLPRNVRSHKLYGMSPVESRDQSQIELYGLRVGATVQGHEICDPIIVGATVSQTILQRALYVRANFSFKLSWEYCLLDPMDIVTISDANLGLSNYPVRLVSIEEDDRGVLSVVAEELTAGISTPALYPTTAPLGAARNQGVAAAPVNPPLIYEPPPALTGGAAQLWIGASGGVGGAADPNCGGAFVWASLDNVAYTQIATLTQRARQGILTANVAPANGFDTTHALAVSMAQSNGALKGTTDSAAQSGVTLALVDNELLAYAVATLSGVNAYSLTRLQRGMYGTGAAAHAAGAQFARLDSAIARYDLPANYIGQNLYLKFQSFNIFGAGIQNLAACAAYSYVPAGTGNPDPIAAQLASGLPLDLGLVSTPASVFDDFNSLTAAATGVVDLGNLTT
jgi:Putative phage tail protein